MTTNCYIFLRYNALRTPKNNLGPGVPQVGSGEGSKYGIFAYFDPLPDPTCGTPDPKLLWESLRHYISRIYNNLGSLAQVLVCIFDLIHFFNIFALYRYT